MTERSAYGEPTLCDRYSDPPCPSAAPHRTGRGDRGLSCGPRDRYSEALATELVCVLRYKRHHFMASGIHAQSVGQEFLQHATEEQLHADQLAQRIVQLGGAPNFSPEGLLTRSHSEYVEGESLLDMIQEDLVAERIAIDSYREMIQYFGNDDPTTRRLMETILAVEEEHAEDLVSLLKKIGA